MKSNEPLLGFIFALFLLILWFGFLVHQDERFAGSLIGGILAISGSLLFLVPLIYSVIKRVPALKHMVAKKVSFSTLLTVHIYSGFIGAILVLLHTGHKFHGLVATLLTTFLLIVVFSGYIGRYLLGRVSTEIGEKKNLLKELEDQYSAKSAILGANSLLRLSESMADVEYAIATHSTFKRVFAVWLKVHILLSFIFYALLVLHISGGYYYGLRWFE